MSIKTIQVQKPTLAAFARTLKLESHVLKDRPDLLWQQMYNRLQWVEGLDQTFLCQEFTRRCEPGLYPWMHQRKRPHESKTLIRTLIGHNNNVVACNISSDGSFLVSASYDNTLKIWDMNTGVLRSTLHGQKHRLSDQGHNNWMSDCAISPDGSYVISTGSDCIIKVWDPQTRIEYLSLTGHNRSILACAISPNGKKIVSASEDKTLKIWDARTGALLHTLEGHRYSVNDCDISPDGRLIVSASSDNTLKLWDATRGKHKATLKGHQETVRACCFSPDGRWIVSASDDKTLILWKTTGFKKYVRTLSGHTNQVLNCCFSPDGHYIVSASMDNTIRIWDPESGVELGKITGHNDDVNDCAISPDGIHVLTASRDSTLKDWDLAAIIEQGMTEESPDSVAEIAISPSGKLMLTTGLDRSLKVRNAHDGSEKQTLIPPMESREAHCDISPDNKYASSVIGDELSIWETETWIVHKKINGVLLTNKCFFSADSRTVITAELPIRIRSWDVLSGEQRGFLDAGDLDNGVTEFETSPDGRFLLLPNSFLQKIIRWEIGTVNYYHHTGHKHGVTRVRYTPDGRWFISASRDKTLKLWGKEKKTLTGHTEAIHDCDVSPDGKWVVSASSDRTLKIWDVPAGTERMTLEGHTGAVMRCVISPDGRWILSRDTDFMLKVWDAVSGNEVSSCFIANSTTIYFNPTRPAVICVDYGGSLHILDLLNIDYGPLIVTATSGDSGPETQCPVCSQTIPINNEQLDTTIICPTEGCCRRLKVNPTVIGQLKKAISPKMLRLIEHAEKGDREAQYELGVCYEKGLGVEVDYIKAVRWYRVAAEADQEEAMIALGKCLIEGKGVEQDFAEGGRWMRKASEY